MKGSEAKRSSVQLKNRKSCTTLNIQVCKYWDEQFTTKLHEMNKVIICCKKTQKDQENISFKQASMY